MSIELKILGIVALAAIILAGRDDPRAFYWVRDQVRDQWRNTVGAYFARRRARIRIDAAPHKACQRDLDCGSWT
jgi:hypothetical protein